MNPHLLLASKGWIKPDYDSFHSLLSKFLVNLKICEAARAPLLARCHVNIFNTLKLNSLGNHNSE